MKARAPRVHLLRRNEAERSPHRVVVIDTESRWIEWEGGELHTLRCWAARLTMRHGRLHRKQEVVRARGETVEELVATLEAWCSTRETCWAFTHNLSFDLGLTRLPLRLLERGWGLGRHNLASDAPWAYLSRGHYALRLCDSASWLPVPVDTLARLQGYLKPPLPEEAGDLADWLARCEADVEITAEAILGLMDEWDRLQLGAWSLTGPATAWNSMLHWPSPEKVVIDPEPEARQFERGAIYSGRRELWTWGPQPEDHYLELDIEKTHLTVAAFCPLPWRRSPVPFRGLPLDSPHLEKRIGLIAECRVRVDEPRYPLKVGTQTHYPVGEFWTRLAKPELIEARRRGELLEIGWGRSYGLGGRMPLWARWALEQLEDGRQDVSPLLRVFLKMASRAVPGRWAMLIARPGETGPTPESGWSLEPASFGADHRRGWILRMAGTRTELIRDQDAEDAFPAVLAFIESYVRVALGRVVDLLGPGAVLQCNTDSILVRWADLEALGKANVATRYEPGESADVLASALRAINATSAPLRWRVKGETRRLDLLSPQHIRDDGGPRFSGIPRSAREPEPGRFEWETWPRLRGQMERGDPRGYVRELRKVQLREVGLNRWAFDCGCTMPPRAAVAGPAASGLLGPDSEACPLHGAPLRGSQGRALARTLKQLGVPV